LAGFSKGAYRGAQSANTSKTIDRTHNGESIQRDWGKAVAKSDGLGGFGGCHGSDGGMQHLSSAKSGARAPSGSSTTVNGVRLLTDGSAVVGEVDPGAIQWLLLRAKSQEGSGSPFWRGFYPSDGHQRRGSAKDGLRRKPSLATGAHALLRELSVLQRGREKVRGSGSLLHRRSNVLVMTDQVRRSYLLFTADSRS
jgi:hypothetical protein